MRRLRIFAARALYGLAESVETLADKVDLPAGGDSLEDVIYNVSPHEVPLARYVDSYGDRGYAPEVHEDPR